MATYGDPAAVHALARRLEELAAGIREQAADLASRAAEVPWQGDAAEAMQRRCHERLESLHRCAAAHERAARALHRHADTVAERRDLAGVIGAILP